MDRNHELIVMPPRRGIIPIVCGALFGAYGLWLAPLNQLAGFILVAMNAPGILVGLLRVSGRGGSLRLNDNGLTVHGFFASRTYPWHDCSEFQPSILDFRGTETHFVRFEWIDSTGIGDSGNQRAKRVEFNDYGLGAADLAEKLNERRKQALTHRASQGHSA